MARRRSASSVPGGQTGRNEGDIPDSGIDYSDIPETTDLELKRARRVGRPRSGTAKQLIAIRIHPGVLARLRRMAERRHKPYQTLIHEILERAVRIAG